MEEQRIKNDERFVTLLEAVLGLAPRERSSFLRNACGDDLELLNALEQQLDWEERMGGFLLDPLVRPRPLQQAFKAGDLAAGRFRVVRSLAEGGMGVVYEAFDEKLERRCALKCAKPGFQKRLSPEARAALRVTHDNVCRVYEIHTAETDHGAFDFLAMEYIEGETLAERIRRSGWLTPAEAAIILQQLCLGLSAAHRGGLLHRDLKSNNVMLMKSDSGVRAVIMDFGLARDAAPELEAFQVSSNLRGAPAYIAPELWCGAKASVASDIYALGVIAYEMVTGQQPFPPETPIEKRMTELPASPRSIVPALGPKWDRMILKCLSPDPGSRFSTVDEVLPAFQPETPLKARFRRARKVIVVAVPAAALLLAYLLRPAMPFPKVVGVLRLSKTGQANPFRRLLTDGTRVYYQGYDGVHAQLRQLMLNGNKDTVAVADFPLELETQDISQDGSRFLEGFGAPSLEDKPVWILPVGEGMPQRLGDLVAHDVAWSRDGSALVYAKGTQLFIARKDGSESRPLASLRGRARYMRWSPDGRRLRFTVLGPWGLRSLWEVREDGRDLHELEFDWTGVARECCGEWTADGRYFIFESRRGNTPSLWMIQDSSDWLHRIDRRPVQLTNGPMYYNFPLPSRDQKAIFAIGGLPLGELLRYDATQKDFVPFLGGQSVDQVEFSRDGKWIAYVRYPEGTLWRARSDGSDLLQLTFPPLLTLQPRWSPDGRRIAYQAWRIGEWQQIYTISADGGDPKPLFPEPQHQVGADWSQNGDSILYSRAMGFNNSKVDTDDAGPAIYRVDLRTGQREKVPGTSGVYYPLASPDGRYLAVVIQGGAQTRTVGARTLLLIDFKTGKRKQLSPRMAGYPKWSADSKYLYFNTIDTAEPALFRVHVPDGKEEKIADVPFRVTGMYWAWSGLTPDGSMLVLRERDNLDIYALSLSSQ